MKTRNEAIAREKDFIEKYDDNKYEKPSVTADIVIFAIFDVDSDNYRKLPEKELKVLLIRRGQEPFKDCYALPGGFSRRGETLKQTAMRELSEETGVQCTFLEELHTFSTPDRDPRGWVITQSFMALIDAREYMLKAGDDAADANWFTVDMEKNQNGNWCIRLKYNQESFSIKVCDQSEPYGVKPRLVQIENEYLAFDHALILADALLMLRKWIENSRLAFRLLPKQFTLAELQKIYEVVLGKKYLPAAFRRKMADRVIETEAYTQEAGHRPARLYEERNR